jgi:hypothetical protein
MNLVPKEVPMTVHNDLNDPLQPRHLAPASPPERYPEDEDDTTEANDEDEEDDEDREDE